MMRRISAIFTGCFILILAMAGDRLNAAEIMPGQTAPGFSLKDAGGKIHDLSGMTNRPMVILYFFDADSRPSQEGLLSLDKLKKRFTGQELVVWGITTSGRESTARFVSQSNPVFPVLLDPGNVSDLYAARSILPTICILGPDLKILDYFQGGGKTTEIMLVKLAERTLQQKQTLVAKAISDTVIEKNPENIKAKTVKGYAEIKEGNLANAEKIFQNVSTGKGEGEILGKEGLSAVYAKKGDTQKALKIAQEVEQMAPERSYAHLVKGDILYSQKKNSEAETEYGKAVSKKEGEIYQKSVALNQSGRFHANQGKFDQARSLYDQAIAIDPYYVEATSNKGMTYEKEGKWENALSAYRQAQSIDKTDTFAAVLAQKAEQMLALQKNAEKRKEIDRLVKELAERFRQQQKETPKSKDTWTSRPMILTFVDLQEKGGLSERDGFSTVITTELGDKLNASGRIKVVERAVLDQLLSELNIGSSELADPETSLKLGRVLAAKIIGTGTLLHMPSSTLMSLRLIDTETTAVPKVITQELDPGETLSKTLHGLTREILTTIIQKYPLQGYIVQATEEKVMLNLGTKQGVVQGTQFEVIEMQAPIEYKGKMLQGSPKPIGQIEIVSAEPDLSYAKVIKKDRTLKQDDQVVEKMTSAL
ncbi:MAG: tetratricopeptide repeat protein [Deltaproteobacteria bacterium]|nr:tetratricopeptide repeat protein [Deltaproteobacteria bacterium]